MGGADQYVRALRNRTIDLRARFIDDPIGLAERFGLRLPRKPVEVMRDLGVYDPVVHGPITPGLRQLVEDVCTLAVRSAAVVGPRGGGKSQGVSFIEFFLVFLKDFDALNLGGSELQADQVYSYLTTYIDNDQQFQKMVEGDTLQSKTTTKRKAWIRVLTASQKSVRSPHAGGRKKMPDGTYRDAGGILVIDEEAEAAPEIVSAALPTINTARPSVNVRSSTFHNAEGSFAELLESAEEMGYETYNWDIFDVAQRCECGPDGCESTESCFREDHFDMVLNPDTGEMERRLLHRAYCAGRARYADGWVPMTEVEALWARIKRNHEVWEVEAMGSRPSTRGYVIKDRKKLDDNTVERAADEFYLPGFPVTVCCDWGTTAAGLTAWQEHPADKHVLLHAELVEEAGETEIIGKILSLRLKYIEGFLEVAADIGGGGNYLNPKLRLEHALPVRDVNFAEEKEAAVAAWNVYNEGRKCVYPKEFTDFFTQVKRWKRKNGRIQKGNDHLPDSSICYFSKFVDRLGLTNIRVPPRSFSASAVRQEQESADHRAMAANAPVVPMHRTALVRTLGSHRRR